MHIKGMQLIVRESKLNVLPRQALSAADSACRGLISRPKTTGGKGLSDGPFLLGNAEVTEGPAVHRTSQ